MEGKSGRRNRCGKWSTKWLNKFGKNSYISLICNWKSVNRLDSSSILTDLNFNQLMRDATLSHTFRFQQRPHRFTVPFEGTLMRLGKIMEIFEARKPANMSTKHEISKNKIYFVLLKKIDQGRFQFKNRRKKKDPH